MKYIKEVDERWHALNEEMPPRTTDVEFLKPNGETVKGQIVIDMAGWYIYIQDYGWSSLSYYTHWRFIEGKHYPYYENKER